MIQRLVKTTPKPRATKKRSGELVGPLPELLLELVCAGGMAMVELGVDIITSERGPYVRDDDGVPARKRRSQKDYCCYVYRASETSSRVRIGG